MLKVDHLSAAYGGIRAIDDISFYVDHGEIVAMLGANGAGKSTLLKCLSGEHKRSAGEISFDGQPLPGHCHQIVERGISIVPEGRQIFYKLTVLENLMVGCCQRNDKEGIQKDLEKVYKLFPRLEERKTQFGGLLSGGEQQMLAIARGLMASPKLLMLDEPSLGLAPIIVNQIMETLGEIAKSGTTILLVEQNAKKALNLCNRAYVMNVGHIVMQGSGQELLADEKLMQAYLG
ncbi:MAG: ABC transporter ATP-binding protein [Flexilinea sp.]|nr:ABC transporter ATP-binding protein [Flexilinea sp.]